MSKFKDLNSLEEVNDFINQNELAFLYFTTPNCSVCHGLQPQIEEMMTHYQEISIRHIHASLVPQCSGQYSVFTTPVLFLFVKGKEYLREASIVQTQILTDVINLIYTNPVN